MYIPYTVREMYKYKNRYVYGRTSFVNISTRRRQGRRRLWRHRRSDRKETLATRRRPMRNLQSRHETPGLKRSARARYIVVVKLPLRDDPESRAVIFCHRSKSHHSLSYIIVTSIYYDLFAAFCEIKAESLLHVPVNRENKFKLL